MHSALWERKGGKTIYSTSCSSQGRQTEGSATVWSGVMMMWVWAWAPWSGLVLWCGSGPELHGLWWCTVEFNTVWLPKEKSSYPYAAFLNMSIKNNVFFKVFPWSVLDVILHTRERCPSLLSSWGGCPHLPSILRDNGMGSGYRRGLLPRCRILLPQCPCLPNHVPWHVILTPPTYPRMCSDLRCRF